MYYYFSSSRPAVVKLNGIYYGQIYDSVKFINIDSPSCFIELCPLNSIEPQVSFFPTIETLNSPPDFISVTNMKGGYLINYSPKNQKNEFSIIAQKKFHNAVITLFTENGYKLSIETPNGIYTENFSFPFEKAEILPFYNENDYYLTVLYGEKIIINVYSIKGNTEKRLTLSATEFDLENYLATTVYKDMAKHVLCEKLIFDGEVKKERVSLKSQKNLSIFDINEKLVPYAMLEELLVGGNVKPYLTGTVLENCDKLPSFFGDFIGVMPPPFFRNSQEVGLIYKNAINKYTVEYFTFEYTEKKLSGIKKE